MPSLDGKVALVTGSASGIGAAVVAKFLSQGAKVVATDIAPLPQDAHDRLHLLKLDTTNEGDWADAITAAQQTFGTIDILVNNAGISAAQPAPIREVDLEDWRKVMAVNLDGVFLGMKHAMRAMDGRGGAIVNLVSMLSFVAIRNSPAYCASKGGVAQLTRAGALEGAEMSPQVRVDSVHPGYVDTPLLASRMAQLDGARARIEGQTPMGRLATCEEIAAAVAFLSSDEASYITGSALTVDGGFTAQ